jgi:hypothetical protein
LAGIARTIPSRKRKHPFSAVRFTQCGDRTRRRGCREETSEVRRKESRLARGAREAVSCCIPVVARPMKSWNLVRIANDV